MSFHEISSSPPTCPSSRGCLSSPQATLLASNFNVTQRPIAIVKWKTRPYCVIKYDYNQPGLYFGIVPLVTCDKVDFTIRFIINALLQVGDYVVRVGDYILSESWTSDLVVRGFVKFIGPYAACLEKYSEFAAQLLGANWRLAEMKKKSNSIDSFLNKSEQLKSTWTSTMESFESIHQMSVSRYFGANFALLFVTAIRDSTSVCFLA